jgi:predicted hydrocarbon binding protein
LVPLTLISPVMVIRKHISIEKKYVDKVRPFLTKHDGNFSAAMREMIDIAVNPRIVLTHSEGVILFDPPIASWLLRKANGMIPEKEMLYEIADPLLFNSVSKTLEYFNIKFRELGWGLDFNLNCDSDIDPTTAVFIIKGENYQLIELSARIFSLFLAVQKNLGIETVYRRTKSIKLTYALRKTAEAASCDLNMNLGVMQDLFCEIEERPDFWCKMVKKYQDSGYKTAAIHLNHFEDLLAKKTPIGEIGIELIAKRPIKDIPFDEFLLLLKEVYETARVVENIDIEGDTLKVFHNYRNPRAVDTLKKIFLHLLEANGHTYNAISTRNLILLRHMPEIGIKISELIANLKKSNSNFDKELIAFLTFLSGLKDESDISESVRALGYRMSKQIFKEYEKEQMIRVWDMKAFQAAFSALDSKIGRLSEWKLVDENSICYSVKNCNLVQISGSFNIDICRFSRGIFKGAIEYVFKNDAEMKVIKLIAHGDDRCEVCIRVHTSLP